MRYRITKLTALLVIVATLATACEDEVNIPRNAAVVAVTANTSLSAWLDGSVDAFNRASVKTQSGKPAYAVITYEEAGETVRNIADGAELPTLWIPDDEVWTSVLAQRGQAVFQGNCQSTATSPLVIAMWRPIAEALGFPGRSLGWLDVGSVAADPSAWEYYSGGNFGPALNIGHTHPGLSASGASTMLAIVQAARSKTEAVSLADVQEPIVQASVAAFEGTVALFSQSPEKLGKTLQERGINYLAAAVVYESTVVNYGGGGENGIVAVYPFEGTFMATHPACVSSAASTEQQEAARLLRDFLVGVDAQKAALAEGLRPVNPDVALGAPLDAEHGVDTSKPTARFNPPSADTIFAVAELWQTSRKPVNLVMLLDTSGSMRGSKIDTLRGAAVQFVEQMGDDDYLTLIPFASRPQALFEHQKVRDVREQAIEEIRSLNANGNTSLYDSIGVAAEILARTSGSQETNAMVVLSDGQDTSSTRYGFSDDLVTVASDNDTTVFTIGYGEDADENVLKRLSSRGRGSYFSGTVANIAAIYEEMSAAFGGSAGIGR